MIHVCLRMIGSESGFELGFDHWGTIIFVPLAKILGDICIVGGTDKLIFIQHFFYIHTGKPTKHFFSPDP